MRILGTGSAVPAFTLENERLTEFLDTSDEWIRTRTGICSRQIMTDETILQMGVEAARNALEYAGVEASELDYILCSTVQADTVTPSLACLLQKEIGANCPAVDINGACSGFVYALDLADAYLKAGKARRMLIVCAEGMSRIANWTDRSTCVLFGDGAGAVVLDAGENRFCAKLTSDGNATPLYFNVHSGNSPFMQHGEEMQGLYMDGPEIYKFAVSHSFGDIKRVAGPRGLKWMQLTTSCCTRPTSASSTRCARDSSSRRKSSRRTSRCGATPRPPAFRSCWTRRTARAASTGAICWP